MIFNVPCGTLNITADALCSNLSIMWIKPTPILNLPREMKEEEEDVPLRLVSLIAFPILTTDGGAEKSPQGLK